MIPNDSHQSSQGQGNNNQVYQHPPSREQQSSAHKNRRGGLFKVNTQSHLVSNIPNGPSISGLMKGGNKTSTNTHTSANTSHLGLSNSNTVMNINPTNSKLILDAQPSSSQVGRGNSSSLRKKMKPYKSN
jgi:hypothetical protein